MQLRAASTVLVRTRRLPLEETWEEEALRSPNRPLRHQQWPTVAWESKPRSRKGSRPTTVVAAATVIERAVVFARTVVFERAVVSARPVVVAAPHRPVGPQARPACLQVVVESIQTP